MLKIWVIGLLGCLFGGINGFTKEEWQTVLSEIVQKMRADAYVGNEEDVLNLYRETAKSLPPEHPAVFGKEGIREFSKMLSDSWELYTGNITGENIVAYTDDVAVAWFNSLWIKSGKFICVPEKGVMVLKKVDGEAKIEMDIWNYDS